ncbi:MAG: thiolase family protein [Pirellulales bacterium]|nr:thiolase family protein [Pirellulales bacterium]
MNKIQPIAVIAGARTPFSKAFTDMRGLSAVELGRQSVLAALKRASLAPRDVDELVMGNVSGPPDAANIARVIALQAELPQHKIAHTVNRNCASGMESILAGWRSIALRQAGLVVAGGTESMSGVPLLFHPQAAAVWMKLAKSKTWRQRLKAIGSFRPKHFKPVIGIELGLTDPVSGLNMGQTAEVLAREFSITREAQDRFALESHQKAAAAQEKCFLSGEIAAVEHAGTANVEKDNGPRHGQSMEQLARLRPIFDKDGSVTAGNSCPLTDGAAALVLAPAEEVGRFVSPPLGYVTHHAIAGCDPRRMGLGPVYATAKLLKQTGLRMSDFDLIEINEAFAAQVLACEQAFASRAFAEQELGMSAADGEVPEDRFNVHGGAIALGHPVGTTGTRLILTLLRALKVAGLRRGLATLCVGGGQGVAMVVETELE